MFVSFPSLRAQLHVCMTKVTSCYLGVKKNRLLRRSVFDLVRPLLEHPCVLCVIITLKKREAREEEGWITILL